MTEELSLGTPPEPGSEDAAQTELPSGMRVLTRERPGADVTAISISVRGGSRDERDETVGALQALPFKQRSAVAYHYLAGLPYADVGELLDSNETAARRAAADGIATLRRHRRGTTHD